MSALLWYQISECAIIVNNNFKTLLTRQTQNFVNSWEVVRTRDLVTGGKCRSCSCGWGSLWNTLPVVFRVILTNGSFSFLKELASKKKNTSFNFQAGYMQRAYKNAGVDIYENQPNRAKEGKRARLYPLSSEMGGNFLFVFYLFSFCFFRFFRFSVKVNFYSTFQVSRWLVK